MTSPNRLPKVAVFSLGGTIASTNDPHVKSGGVVPKLGAAELVAALPQLEGEAHLESISFRQVASGNLTFADVIELADAINVRFRAGADGAVVIQGTDSIEETSFALSLLVDSPRPVAVTGAMRNTTLPGADGPANLLAAVQVAVSPAAHGLGTVVVFNDEIHSARYVRKTHTTNPSTFRSVNVGPLGWVVEGHPRVALRPVQTLPKLSPPAEGVPQVALLRTSLGDDERLVQQIEAAGYAGLILEAFGGGHVPALMVPALGYLAQRMPVVLASRTGGGEVLIDTYGFQGSERDLISRGLIPSGDLDGLKSRVLMTLLLADGADATAITRVFRSSTEFM